MGKFDKITGIFNKKKKGKEEVIEVGEKKKANIVMLVDRKIPNMSSFFRDRGIHLSELYTNIEDTKIGLMIQGGYTRLVVIESGLGKFTTTNTRAEINDLLGMCNGEDIVGTVFYTDSVLKAENTKGRRNKAIDWRVYEGTINTIEVLNGYNEEYNHVEEREDKLQSREEALRFIGETVEVINGIKPKSELELTEKVLNLLRNDNIGNEETLPSFEPIY